MKLLAAALLAATALAAPASAAIITVTLTGTVDANSFGNSGYTVGQTLDGALSYDTATGLVSSFTVGKYALSGARDSFLPASLTATDTVVISALQTDGTGATTGTGFNLNLYYPTPSANTTDLAHFLNNTGGFLGASDPISPSFFSYTNNGAGVRVEATLSTLAAPEPMTMALLGTAGAALFAARRRR